MSVIPSPIGAVLALYGWIQRRRRLACWLLGCFLLVLALGWYALSSVLCRIHFHRAALISLAWNPAGTVLAAVYEDNSLELLSFDEAGRITVRELNRDGGTKEVKDLTLAPYQFDNGLSWSSDGSMLAALMWKRDTPDPDHLFSIGIWDAGAGNPGGAVATFRIPNTTGRMVHSWHPKEKRLAFLPEARDKLVIWAPATSPSQPAVEQNIVLQYEIPPSRAWTTGNLAWSPDGTELTRLGLFGKLLSIYGSDGINRRNLTLDDKGHFEGIFRINYSLVLSPDASRLVLEINGENCVELPNVERIMNIYSAKGELVRSVPLPLTSDTVLDSHTQNREFSWSPDGRQIVYSLVRGYFAPRLGEEMYRHSRIMVWNADTGELVASRFSNYEGKILRLPFAAAKPILRVLPADIAVHPQHKILAQGDAIHIRMPWSSYPIVWSMVRTVPMPTEVQADRLPATPAPSPAAVPAATPEPSAPSSPTTNASP